MRGKGSIALGFIMAVIGCLCPLLAGHVAAAAASPYKPEGEMRWALYVTISPAWFDPSHVAVTGLNHFWFGYALHDALVRPMPDTPMAPSLAETWTVSDDQRVYEFTLRQGLTFHNGDPFTAEDVKFTFLRYKSPILHAKVRDVEVGRSPPGAFPSAPTVARFHGLLWDAGYGGWLDRAEKVPRAGRR